MPRASPCPPADFPLVVRIVASIAGLIAGLWTLNLARELDAISLAGMAIPATILLLAAGLVLDFP